MDSTASVAPGLGGKIRTALSYNALEGMLYFERSARLGDGRARRESRWLRAPGLNVYVCQAEGLVFDAAPLQAMTDGVFGTARAGRRFDYLTIVLDGAQVVRSPRAALELRPGDVVLDGRPEWNERWEGAPYRTLTVEWQSPFGAPVASRENGRVSRRLVSAATSFADRLAEGTLRGAAGEAAVRELLLRARAEGLPVRAPEPGELGTSSAEDEALAATVSWLETNLHLQPMWIDVQARLGLSERHGRRVLAEREDLARMPGGSLRAHLRRLRAVSAAALLTAPDATAEEVARAIGYGSERALATALHQMGLPGPRELRRAVLVGAP
jgi:AraC-like DNA-binding protein